MKASQIFEGENSSLKKTFDEVVRERTVEEIVTDIILSVGRTGDVEGEIAKALTAERQKREEVVEIERERIVKITTKNKDAFMMPATEQRWLQAITQPNNK